MTFLDYFSFLQKKTIGLITRNRKQYSCYLSSTETTLNFLNWRRPLQSTILHSIPDGPDFLITCWIIYISLFERDSGQTEIYYTQYSIFKNLTIDKVLIN